MAKQNTVKPIKRYIVSVTQIRPYWNWRIKRGHEYEVMGDVGDYYFVWANGTFVALPKADKDTHYTISQRIFEEDPHGCNPYCTYPES